MELELTNKSPFELIAIKQEGEQCCLLCHEGQNVYQKLVDHFKEFHYEDYSQLPDDSIIQLCSCPDALQLQFKLINHMLSKSLANQLPETSELDPQPKRIRRTKLEIEEGDYAIKCEFCPRIFTKSQSLQNHYQLMHDPSNPFKCTICSTGHCKTAKSLTNHLKVHEEELKIDKSCTKCDKKWKTDLQLYHHMLSHREKELECDHCGMKFNMKNTLWRHIKTHFKESKNSKSSKKTLCQFCSMWVSFYNLKRHIRTSHSDNKRIYTCDFEGCGKSFTERQTKKDHLNLHLGLKPYVCEFCSMSFPHIATLRRHRYRHTNPEKYKCEKCGENFVTRKSMMNHKQRQHEDIKNDFRPFACGFENCSSTFKYENYLQNHIRDVHVKRRNRVRRAKSDVAPQEDFFN